MEDPEFSRSEVAKILHVSTLTIANREKSGKYPEPKRNLLNNYRVYSLKDVVNLQRLTYDTVDYSTIISILYDKGYTDVRAVSKMIDQVDTHIRGNS